MIDSRAGLVDVMRNRNFRALWMGQLVSQIGDSFVTVAALVLVNGLTSSPLPIVTLVLCITLPQLLFGLIGGVFVDRLDRKMVMITADVLRALLVPVAILVQRADQLYILYLAAFAVVTLSVFFSPARNATIPNIIEEDMLLTANALIQANQIIAMIFGSAAAGLIIGWLGTTFAFLFDAATFAVSAVFIATMRIPARAAAVAQTSLRVIWGQLVEGLAFVKRHATLVSIMGLTAAATLGLSTITVLGIIYLDEELGVGAEGFGFLMSVQGLGVVIGGLLISRIARRWPAHQIVGACLAVLGVAIIVFALAPSYSLVLLAVAIIGLCIVATRAGLATLTQALVPDEKRGRVESVVNLVIGLSTSAAMAVSGLLGQVLGVRIVFISAGSVTVLSGVAAAFTLREPTRLVMSHRRLE